MGCTYRTRRFETPLTWHWGESRSGQGYYHACPKCGARLLQYEMEEVEEAFEKILQEAVKRHEEKEGEEESVLQPDICVL